MSMKRFSKEELARNLDKVVGAKYGGMRGINILIYGWLHYRKYGKQYRKKIHSRDWLFITEVRDLSDYAQCDLSG